MQVRNAMLLGSGHHTAEALPQLMLRKLSIIFVSSKTPQKALRDLSVCCVALKVAKKTWADEERGQHIRV